MPAEAPTDRRILSPSVVGRLSEIESFDRVLTEVLHGCGRAMLVSGDPGVGKTALVHALIRRVPSEVHVLLGECLSIESARPFGPFIDILRSAIRLFGSDVEQLLDERAVELMRLLPERRRQHPLGEPRRDDWHRLHVSFAALLEGLARQHPIVVVLEDLHWADDASLELLPYLLRKLKSVPALVLGTHRTLDETTGDGLTTAISELQRTRMIDELRLGPLSVAESGEVVRLALHLRRHAPPEFRQLVHDQSEGNPFYLEELLKEFVEGHDLRYRDGSWVIAPTTMTAVPTTVRATVERRLARLSETTRRALRIAAMVGPRFDLDVVCQIVGLDSAERSRFVRDGVGAQLLSHAQIGQGLYSFRHTLTREAILGTVLASERAGSHRAVADALEANVLAQIDPDELARHYEEAGDASKAFRYHILAADNAAAVLARGRERFHLERAIELAPPEAPKGPLYLRLDDVLTEVTLRPIFPTGFGRDESARRQILMAALRSLEHEGDRKGMGRVLVELAHGDLSPGANAQDAYARGLDVLESCGPSDELCRARSSVAETLSAHGRPDDAIVYSRLAVETARFATPSTQALALSQLGQLLGVVGQLDEGVVYARRALEIALTEDAPEVVERCYYGLEQVLYDHPIEERRRHDEHIAYARKHGLHERPFITWTLLTWSFHDRDWDTAGALLANFPPDNPWDHYAQTTFASRIVAARSGPRQGLAIIDEHGGQFPGVAAFCGAIIKVLADDPAGALNALEGYDEERDAFRRFPKRLLSLLASSRLDDATFERSREYARTGLTGMNAEACAELAFGLEAARTGARQAIAHLERCIALFAGLRRSLELEHFVRLELIRVRIARGEEDDLAQAEAELAEILAFWEKPKATWLIAQILRSARAGGIHPGRSGTARLAVSPRSRLTRREREVASLVAEGLTNRQIAERLVIADRTAEGHVEQIREKLGFHSRVQIATWIATHRTRSG